MKAGVQKLKIGVALLPDLQTQKLIYTLSNDLVEPNWAFVCRAESSVPHCTLFQGIFESSEKVIDLVKTIKLESFDPTAKFTKIQLWAKQYIFLNIEETTDLKKLHQKSVELLVDITDKNSLPNEITQRLPETQKSAYYKTGYPLAYDEFLPHFTLGGLANPSETPTKLEKKLNKQLKLKDFDYNFRFQKLIVFRIGAYGSCEKILMEKNLA